MTKLYKKPNKMKKKLCCQGEERENEKENKKAH